MKNNIDTGNIHQKIKNIDNDDLGNDEELVPLDLDTIPTKPQNPYTFKIDGEKFGPNNYFIDHKIPETTSNPTIFLLIDEAITTNMSYEVFKDRLATETPGSIHPENAEKLLTLYEKDKTFDVDTINTNLAFKKHIADKILFKEDSKTYFTMPDNSHFIKNDDGNITIKEYLDFLNRERTANDQTTLTDLIESMDLDKKDAFIILMTESPDELLHDTAYKI